ncbi:hypothetical protein C7T35_35965 [Variovorax sp. WS11]|uniref:CesT family type III secretion system chaperone n=1 Tax=Variovorax sp. WS11 TaxID=1105204 RepID=UPI000D0DB56A|nr:CesT family type III secretion system chaperone [Variovorax sp. WS11]NDZ13966.1 hypothetical protein [Variovorax sp. WS11]PSL79716.1 hypothetical protein C7T35_35965 [Variovorax sp. WS11]
MSREDYVELMQDFCKAIGFEEVGELLHQGVLQLDDTLIGIEYLDARKEIRLLMDLGDMEAEEDRVALFSVLLEFNSSNNGLYLPIFSMHPESGHVIVAYHLPLKILRDQSIGLAFVLDEQLIPLLDEWKSAIRQALDDVRSNSEALLPIGTLA